MRCRLEFEIAYICDPLSSFTHLIFHMTLWSSILPLSLWILCLCRNALENAATCLSFLSSSSYRPSYPWRRLSLKSTSKVLIYIYIYPQLCLNHYILVFCDKFKNILAHFVLCSQYMMWGIVFNKMSSKPLLAISNTSFFDGYSTWDYIQNLFLISFIKLNK